MTKEIKRPTWNAEMQVELDEEISKEIFNWCGGETSIDTIIEDLKKVPLRYNPYEQARCFENIGYFINFELIKIFEKRISNQHRIYHKFIMKWVSDNEIKLNLKVEQKISYKNDTFIITSIYPDTYQIGIWNESLPYEKYKGARIVNVEDVEEIKNETT